MLLQLCCEYKLVLKIVSNCKNSLKLQQVSFLNYLKHFRKYISCMFILTVDINKSSERAGERFSDISIIKNLIINKLSQSEH